MPAVNSFSAKRRVITLLSCIVAFFASCKDGNSSQSAATTNVTGSRTYDMAFVKGKIIDSVICRADAGQSYALFLPSYYTAGSSFPCIYFFDAHARGGLPLRNYVALAEKYGFILVGSNTSKNGTPPQLTEATIKALFDDTRERINIDNKRVYTSGFSGGSRVASMVAIMKGGVTGVIGCAAGFPRLEQGIQNKFDYFGVVGEYDFNLAEMGQLDETLAQNGFTHQLLTFPGTHGWPAAGEFETALLWMQVNAMKVHSTQKNDTIINALKYDFDKRIDSARLMKDWVKVATLEDGLVRELDGLADVSAYKKQLTELTASKAYTDAKALQVQMQQAETRLQQEFGQQFTTQSEQWWVDKIAELNKHIHRLELRQESDMNRRLLSYIGLVGYMTSNQAVMTGDLANAERYLRIFKLADPTNADCSYLSAIYYEKKGDSKMAITMLQEAAKLGYSEVNQLVADPAFAGLQNDADFKQVVEKVRANYTSK